MASVGAGKRLFPARLRGRVGAAVMRDGAGLGRRFLDDLAELWLDVVFDAPPLFIRAELPAATKIAAVFITFPTLFFKYSNAFA